MESIDRIRDLEKINDDLHELMAEKCAEIKRLNSVIDDGAVQVEKIRKILNLCFDYVGGSDE